MARVNPASTLYTAALSRFSSRSRIERPCTRCAPGLMSKPRISSGTWRYFFATPLLFQPLVTDANCVDRRNHCTIPDGRPIASSTLRTSSTDQSLATHGDSRGDLSLVVASSPRRAEMMPSMIPKSRAPSGVTKRSRDTHSLSSLSRHDQSRVYSFSVTNVPVPSPRTLYVEGLVNARDLGGLRRVDGTTTPRGVFYRSENVDGVTPAGWEQIYQTGIRTIVDLREPSERASDRNERPSWIHTETVELNGFANDEFWRDYLPNGLARTALYFLPHLEAMPKRAVSALSAISFTAFEVGTERE